MTRNVSVPEELLRQAEQLAEQEHISVDELVAAALAEQFAGVAYLRKRGERASAERFRAALDQIPDAVPDPRDRLQ